MRGVSFRLKGTWRGVLFCAKVFCAVFHSVLRARGAVLPLIITDQLPLIIDHLSLTIEYHWSLIITDQ